MHTTVTEPAERRVREQARDAVAVMAFSVAASAGVAVALVLIASLGR